MIGQGLAWTGIFTYLHPGKGSYDYDLYRWTSVKIPNLKIKSWHQLTRTSAFKHP